MKDIGKHPISLGVLGQLSAGDGGEILRFAIHGRGDEQLVIHVAVRNNDSKNRATLVHPREVMLLLVEGLSELEEVIQPQELADALVQTPTGYQPILLVVYEEHFVYVVGGSQGFIAGLDYPGRITLGIIVIRTSLVGHQDLQVTGEFVDPVDSAQVNVPSSFIHHQVVEVSLCLLSSEGDEGPLWMGWLLSAKR